MRWCSPNAATAAWLALLLPASFALNVQRNYDAHDYYAVHLSPSVLPREVSSHLGLHYDGQLGELPDHHVFRAEVRQPEHDRIKRELNDLKLRRRKRDPVALEPHILDHVLFTQKQELHKRFPLVKREDAAPAADQKAGNETTVDPAVQKGIDIARRLNIDDPIFHDQWHLYNAVQKGHDINVTGVWDTGITGRNSTVCIVDDGLDLDSDDLSANYFAAGSYDFNDQVNEPKPRLADDRHGTRCAGEVSAVRNNVCGVGVAYDSKISGVRILSKVISDADEASAMNYAYQENDIFSCSWGPPDDGRSMAAPGLLIKRAMVNGVQNGRHGLGSIYVFAIGNGAANDDNCNFDGYTNSIYSVSVGGIDREGHHPYYSEACSAQLVVTYSSGSGDAIHTTDVGKNACYEHHGGTSAAGPLVAGIYALVLEANPKLTWRDIQWITVLTAIRIDQPADWKMNQAIGKEFSHDFGYGKADAWALVEMARNWTNVKPQAWFYSPWLSVKKAVPQGDQGLASSYTITKEQLEKANFARIEHVTVTMNVEHTRRGDLSVELISPSGMVSHISTARRNDNAVEGYVDWTFMSVAHWAEDGIGKWTVIVKDTNVNDHEGTFIDWHLKLWGECINADVARLLPLPNEHDDDHSDPIPTQTVSASLTSIVVPTQTGEPEGNPDDHQHRPVNNKSSKTTTTPTPTPTDASTNESAPSPTPTQTVPEGDDKVEEVTPTTAPSTPTTTPSKTTTKPSSAETTTSLPSSDFLPRPFPNFGVSKRTQIWIYGALVLIIIFLIALTAWWCTIQRRRRRWMVASRGDYGFEMVGAEDGGVGEGEGDDDERHAMLRGGGRRKKRAGELYDAFATGDSEGDDDELFGVGEDESDEDREDIGGHGKESRYRDTEPLREGTDV